MDINASIVDQQLTGLLGKYPDWFTKSKDENQKRARAFTLLCMSNYLDLPLEDSLELLTDGGNDAGVDGLQIGEVGDGEFLVTLFQSKYKIKDFSGTANFPENAVQKVVNTVQVLFDPLRPVTLNNQIAPKIEEIRSLIQDAYIPRVRVILCNNGAKWNDQGQQWITQLKQDYHDKIEICHFNHDSIVNILQKTKTVDATLQLNGQIIVEDMNFMRVLVGRIAVHQIAQLFEQHGDRLLQRNIRRYLGLTNNRVNTAIHQTLCSDKSDKFYFYNNGITVVCDKFDYNSFQKSDYQVQVKNMQIINGGQTCKTIYETLTGSLPGVMGEFAFVLIRLYQLAENQTEFVQDITYATNSQNPVDLQDLRSNDDRQKQLEIGIQSFGYSYKRQREDRLSSPNIIPSSITAEAVLAIWREKPHQAKFRRKEHFGQLYDDIFQDLNAAQAILAVLIFRYVDNTRKQANPDNSPDFLPYASHYLAMLIGRLLLHHHHLQLNQVSHLNFADLKQAFETHQDEWHQTAIQQITQALKDCYGERNISLQQLSATFRRGDLLEMLQGVAA